LRLWYCFQARRSTSWIQKMWMRLRSLGRNELYCCDFPWTAVMLD
jgi:hypothetical protein